MCFVCFYLQAAIVGTVGTPGFGDLAIDEVEVTEEPCNVPGMVVLPVIWGQNIHKLLMQQIG